MILVVTVLVILLFRRGAEPLYYFLVPVSIGAAIRGAPFAALVHNLYRGWHSASIFGRVGLFLCAGAAARGLLPLELVWELASYSALLSGPVSRCRALWRSYLT